MKAIGLTNYGGPEVLRPIELPLPEVGPGEVRIRVRAAAVNPVDTIIRAGHFAGKDGAIPVAVVPGMDVAGTIDAIGPDQPAGFDLEVGDPVIGFIVPDGTHGGYSQQIVLPSESLTRKPPTLTFPEAASFLSNALTAEIALEALNLKPGATLAVTGATGAVGGYLVELASQRGLVVIASASAAEKDLVQGFGASIVLDRDADFAAGVRVATEGVGVDALADPAILTDQVIDAVTDGGQIAFFLPTDVEPGRGISVFRSYVMQSSRRHDVIERLARLAGDGKISLRVAGRYPAVDAAESHRRLEEGSLRGRSILEF
ncbi:quinone oxidoreductase family protein [Frondihabitans cladoniiphilus]|uniref:NADP-dependent oxidoreductase n=1 Tax=Frondihabitans cladoniiphilus TaxID=715785 RepID=A0ABP8W9S3_9MICO